MTLFTIFSGAVVERFPSHETIRCLIYMGEPSQIQSESVYLFCGSLKDLLHMLHWIFDYRFLNTWVVLIAEKAADSHRQVWAITHSEDFRPPPDLAQYRPWGIHPLCCLIPLPDIMEARARFSISLHTEEGAFHTFMKGSQLTQNYKVKKSI